MNLPFTVEQFLEVFKAYNLALWPMQLVAYVIGVGTVLLVLRRAKNSNKLVNLALGLFWIWNGIVYHMGFFSSINRAAYLFGALFIIQGLMFLILGVLKNRIIFQLKPDVFSVTGGLFILYAMVIYPLIGFILGHGYPFSPSFGLAPCPTTIFTLGLLLWAGEKAPRKLLWVPLAWSMIGFNAALKLGILEDMGLLVAGILASGMILWQKKRLRTQSMQEGGLEMRRGYVFNHQER